MKILWATLVAIVASASIATAQSWETVWEGGNFDFVQDIEFVNAQVAWAATREEILRTTDGGMTWLPTDTPALTSFYAIRPFGPDSAWAVSTDKVLWTIDRGQTWIQTLLNFRLRQAPPFGFWDIDCTDFLHCVVVGTQVYRTIDGGENWERTTPITEPASFLSVSMVSEDTVWALDARLVFQSVDGGATWRQVDVGIECPAEPCFAGKSEYMWNVQFFDSRNGIAHGIWRAESVTTDGGQTWTPRERGADCNHEQFLDFHFTDLQTGWAVGFAGQVYVTDDGWETCENHSFPSQPDGLPIYDGLFVLPGEAVFVGGREPPGVIKRLSCNGLNVKACNGIEDLPLPLSTLELQSYPNPFGDSATIRFALEEPAAVRILVLDILGRTVGTLLDERLPPGEHSKTFHAGDLPAGQYYYRITANGASETRGLVLTRH